MLGLFGSHVFQGAGRLLEDSVAVGISQSEVDDLQVVAVVGHHDVLRLQVAVDYLLRMDIGQGLGEFCGDALTFLL